MGQARDYGREFDETVEVYNEWFDEKLASLERPKRKRRSYLKAFLDGMLDCMAYFSGPVSLRNSRIALDPVMSRSDLSGSQKDLVKLASDLHRVRGLPHLQQGDIQRSYQGLYEYYRNQYILSFR